jgi:hypothetical protein
MYHSPYPLVEVTEVWTLSFQIDVEFILCDSDS